MLAERTEAPPPTQASAHATFFRHSGWMMIANVLGGALNWAVHFLNRVIPVSEYGNFGVFLAVVMLVPAIPLQMILAQQTAKALATGRTRELSGLIRKTWLTVTLVWLALAVLVLSCQSTILSRWHVSNPLGLWITLAVLLFSLWLPMFSGILQGQQNFFALGWSAIVAAFGRIGVAAFAVLVLHAYAPGMLAGVLIGTAAGAVVVIWPTRSLWLAKPLPFEWSSVTRQLVPLFVGFLGFQIMFNTDTMFVKTYFTEKEAGFYVSAGTLSRALLWLVLPLAAVMFPRIVQSAARSEKSNLIGLVLLGTAVLGILGALSLSVLGPYIIPLVYGPDYVAVVSAILPWYAFAMVPLAVANVLLNNLMARPAGQLIPALCIFGLALGYLFALTQFHDSLVTVLKTLGTCNLLLLGICGWFSWRHRVAPTVAADPAA